MVTTAVCLSAFLMTFQVGVASRFRPGERLAGRTLMCHRYMKAEPLHAAMQEGCAHRFLPCGVRLWVEDQRTHRASTCTVVDRGPYGAIDRGRWVIKRRSDAPGSWRGILDVLPQVAERLGLRGLDPVVVRVLPQGSAGVAIVKRAGSTPPAAADEDFVRLTQSQIRCLR